MRLRQASHQRLQRGGGVVHVAGGAPHVEGEAAVGVLLARDPRARGAHREVARRVPGGAQREDGERGEVDLVGEGAVALGGSGAGPPAGGLPASVVTGAPQARSASIVRSSSPAPSSVPRLRAQRVEHGVAVAAHALRVAPGGGEAERRPRGVQLAGGLPRRGAPAAVGVLRGGEVGDLARDRGRGRATAASGVRCGARRAAVAEAGTAETAGRRRRARRAARTASGPPPAARPRVARRRAPSGRPCASAPAPSTRASSGAKARPKRKRGDDVGDVEGQRAAGHDRRNAAGVWVAPRVHVYTFMISFASSAVSAQASASGIRPRRLPESQPSAAPIRPTSPQAAICHGV